VVGKVLSKVRIPVAVAGESFGAGRHDALKTVHNSL